MQLVNNEITSGSKYGWDCFGPNAYCYDSYDNENVDISVTFDQKDQTVYEFTAVNANTNSAFRWANPAFVDRYNEEAKNRGCDPDQAWDDVKYIDIKDANEFLDIARDIVSGDFERKHVKVAPLLDQGEMYLLMKQAHEKNLTLNDYVSAVLRGVARGRLTFTIVDEE